MRNKSENYYTLLPPPCLPYTFSVLTLLLHSQLYLPSWAEQGDWEWVRNSSPLPLLPSHLFSPAPVRVLPTGWIPVFSRMRFSINVVQLYIQSWCSLPAAGKSLLWNLDHLIPTWITSSLTLVSAMLIFTPFFFLYSSPLIRQFYSFLKFFSQMCYHLGWWAQLCPELHFGAGWKWLCPAWLQLLISSNRGHLCRPPNTLPLAFNAILILITTYLIKFRIIDLCDFDQFFIGMHHQMYICYLLAHR